MLAKCCIPGSKGSDTRDQAVRQRMPAAPHASACRQVRASESSVLQAAGLSTDVIASACRLQTDTVPCSWGSDRCMAAGADLGGCKSWTPGAAHDIPQPMSIHQANEEDGAKRHWQPLARASCRQLSRTGLVMLAYHNNIARSASHQKAVGLKHWPPDHSAWLP